MKNEIFKVGQIVDYKGKWWIIDSIRGVNDVVFYEEIGICDLFNGKDYEIGHPDEKEFKSITYQR